MKPFRRSIECALVALSFVAASCLWIASPASAAPSGLITTIAGTGTSASNGNGGPATSAAITAVGGMVYDGSGNLIFTDYYANVLRKIAPDGTISNFAGIGTGGESGDGGQASAADFNHPYVLTSDAQGNIYVGEWWGGTVRKIAPNGIVTTVAGNYALGSGYSGDGGPATSAQLSHVSGIAVDGVGNLYIADEANYVVRKVNPAGIISTYAGTNVPGYSGDGGPATAAMLASLEGLAVDKAGNVFVSDWNNHVVRRISTGGIITTAVGNGSYGYSGDGGPATSATLIGAEGLAFDSLGNLYVNDDNDVVRRVATDGTITTVAGNGSKGYSGDGGVSTAAQLNGPTSVVISPTGDLLIGMWSGSPTIRKVAAITGTPLQGTASLAVDAAITFSVGTHAGACNGAAQTGTSTATAVTLGRAVAGSPSIGAQDLSVSTNASGGFVVYVSGTSMTGPVSLPNVSGSNASPAALGAGASYGYTVNDTDLARFAGPLWAAMSATPAPVMSNAAVGSATNCVAYEVTTAATTPAGSYSAVVTYSAVPTF